METTPRRMGSYHRGRRAAYNVRAVTVSRHMLSRRNFVIDLVDRLFLQFTALLGGRLLDAKLENATAFANVVASCVQGAYARRRNAEPRFPWAILLNDVL